MFHKYQLCMSTQRDLSFLIWNLEPLVMPLKSSWIWARSLKVMYRVGIRMIKTPGKPMLLMTRYQHVMFKMQLEWKKYVSILDHLSHIKILIFIIVQVWQLIVPTQPNLKMVEMILANLVEWDLKNNLLIDKLLQTQKKEQVAQWKKEEHTRNLHHSEVEIFLIVISTQLIQVFMKFHK